MSNPIESPCNTCDYKHRDKDHPDCVDCDLRLGYAVAEGMLHPEVLEIKEDDPIIMEAREMVAIKKKKGGKCSTPHCDGVATIKGKCQSCYGKAYYRANQLKEKQLMICDEPGCDEDVKARGKCQNHYRAWIRKNPDKARKYEKNPNQKRAQICFHFGDKTGAKEILNELAGIARKELRRTTEQGLIFIREGIERWKGEHKGGIDVRKDI